MTITNEKNPNYDDEQCVFVDEAKLEETFYISIRDKDVDDFYKSVIGISRKDALELALKLIKFALSLEKAEKSIEEKILQS